MYKRVTLVVVLLGMVCSVEASEPKRVRRRWTTGTLRTLKRKKDPKQVLLDEMNQAWEHVESIFNQQVQQVSGALGDIEAAMVAEELNKSDKQSSIAGSERLFQTAVANYLETYLPTKLLDEHPHLQYGDEVIQQAELNKAKADSRLTDFKQQFVKAVRQLKDPQPPQSPPRTRPAHQPSVSLETRVTRAWSKILQEIDQSATAIAVELDIETNQDDNSLRAQLASNPELVQEKYDDLVAMIEGFEKTWKDLFSKFSDEVKKDAVDMFNGFVNTKPQSIDDFNTKIIESWRSGSGGP